MSFLFKTTTNIKSTIAQASYRRSRNTNDAEDLTSQVFMEAAECLTKYRERSRFSAWLVAIAHQRLAEYYHRQWANDLLVDVEDETQNLQLG